MELFQISKMGWFNWRKHGSSRTTTKSIDKGEEDKQSAISSIPSLDEVPEVELFTKEEEECVKQLQTFCKTSRLNVSDELIWRFAVYHGFSYRKASQAISKQHDDRYVNLRMEDELAEYMKTSMACVTLPEVRTTIGAGAFYYYPARFENSDSNAQLMLKSFVYVLNDMSRTPEQCAKGVVQIINLKDYSLRNYNKELMVLLTDVSEGKVIPTRISQILILNAPKVFGIVWRVATLFMSAVHRRRIRMIHESQLKEYLLEGYEEHLPSELVAGGKPISEMVTGYVDTKKFEEEQKAMKWTYGGHLESLVQRSTQSARIYDEP